MTRARRNCLFLAGTASNIFANVSFTPSETVVIVDPPRLVIAGYAVQACLAVMYMRTSNRSKVRSFLPCFLLVALVATARRSSDVRDFARDCRVVRCPLPSDWCFVGHVQMLFSGAVFCCAAYRRVGWVKVRSTQPSRPAARCLLWAWCGMRRHAVPRRWYAWQYSLTSLSSFV